MPFRGGPKNGRPNPDGSLDVVTEGKDDGVGETPIVGKADRVVVGSDDSVEDGWTEVSLRGGPGNGLPNSDGPVEGKSDREDGMDEMGAVGSAD